MKEYAYRGRWITAEWIGLSAMLLENSKLFMPLISHRVILKRLLLEDTVHFDRVPNRWANSPF
jgi:hypothetical protein